MTTPRALACTNIAPKRRADDHSPLAACGPPRPSQSIVMRCVQRNGHALVYAASRLQYDRDVVIAAVRQDGGALRYAADELQEDKEIVKIAVAAEGVRSLVTRPPTRCFVPRPPTSTPCSPTLARCTRTFSDSPRTRRPARSHPRHPARPRVAGRALLRGPEHAGYQGDRPPRRRQRRLRHAVRR